MKIKKEVLNTLKTGFYLKPFEERMLMLAAKTNFLLRDESSSFFPNWLFQGVFQATCRAFLYESSIHKKICSLLKSILLPRTWSPTNILHTPTQGLIYLFYPAFRVGELISKCINQLARSATKIIFRKMR